jgi:hypothetical protein
MAGILKVDRIQSDSNLSFAIGSSNVAYFNTTSGLVLNNSTLQTNGIKFPATQVSSDDANTLDDYEEGTWTPQVNLLGTLTYTAYQVGKYQKVGNRVTVGFMVGVTSSDTTQDSGTLKITGLPYAVASGGDFWYNGVIPITSERFRGRANATAVSYPAVGATPGEASLTLFDIHWNGTLTYQTYMTTAFRSCYGSASNLYLTGQISYIAST